MSRQSCSSNADGRSVITNWKLNDIGLWNNCYTFWFCSIYLKVDWIQDFFIFFFSCTISHTLCFHWNSNVSFLLSNRSITLPLICEHIWWSKAVWSAQSIFVLQFFQYKMFFGFYCETDLESHFFLLCYSIFVYMLDIFLAHLPWWHLEHRIFFSSRKIYFPVLFVILHFRFSIYHKIMRAY